MRKQSILYCYLKRNWRTSLILLAIMTTGARAASEADKQTSTKDVAFKAKCDKSEQKYLLIYPPGFNDGEVHNVLILLHGHGSDRMQVLDESVAEFRAGRDVAANRGMLVVSPDYRARTSWMGPKAEA